MVLTTYLDKKFSIYDKPGHELIFKVSFVQEKTSTIFRIYNIRFHTPRAPVNYTIVFHYFSKYKLHHFNKPSIWKLATNSIVEEINRREDDKRRQKPRFRRGSKAHEPFFSFFPNRQGLSLKSSHLFANIFCGLTAGKPL